MNALRVALAGALFAIGSYGADNFTIFGLPLGVTPDGGQIDALYEEKIHSRIVTSVMLTAPYSHIDTDLKNDEKLEIHFSSVATGRKAFWLYYSRILPNPGISPAKPLAEAKAQFGAPTAQFGEEDAEDQVLIFQTAGARKAPSGKLKRKQYEDFFWGDIQARAELLGPDFKGAIVMIVGFKGKATRVVTELMDLPLASSVLNLGQSLNRR